MGLDSYRVAGDFDDFRKIGVSDTADFERLHGTTPIALPSLRQTVFVMKATAADAPLHP